MKRLALLLALAAALVAPAHAASPLTVYAAASLKETFPRIEGSANYSFGGSDVLAFQIQQGAPADVYAAASPKYPEELYRRGLVEKPLVFATNRLVLLVPKGSAIRSVFDLRRRDVKLVVGAKGVPIGDYTRAVLGRLGLAALAGRAVSQEPDVKGIVGKVALGQADAGFVYATDAKPVADRTAVVQIPARAQPKVRYEIAVVEASKHKAAARAFVQRVLSKAGRAKLADAGFGLPAAT